MASKSKTVKFEVGQLVEFNNRMGRVSRIAKNGAIYVIVLGEIQGAEQAFNELRVKKADLRLIEESEAQQEIELATQESETCADAAQEIVAEVQEPQEPAQSPLDFPTEPKEDSQSVALADAAYALRELTFSVTRHSILTAFIDVALNKDIPGYNYQVASNIKNLMAAAFDPAHDSGGYARINTWMMAALELVVKNKERVAKMLNQPIEAAPIKMDRVTKLGMWLDKNMQREGQQVNDLTSAYDSCYMYNPGEKKLEACAFVVVEAAQALKGAPVTMLPIPSSVNQEFSEHLTAQSAIAVRKQYIDYWRQLEPDLASYCGIVPILKTGLSMQAAIDDTLASVINSIK